MSQHTRASRIRYLFQLFKTALLGTEKDFTTGSINRAIFLLSVPMVLEMVMESLFSVADAYFVGKIGKDAVATVGLTESALTIIYSVAMGLSMAITATVARRIGEKNPDGAAHAAVQGLYLGCTLSILISMTGLYFAQDILLLMGAKPEVVAANYHYTQIMMASNVIIVLLFLINGIFRGAGDASIAMRSLWLANALNIILCPLLINGLGPIPALGLKGAALATTIGRGSGVVYQLYRLNSGKSIIRITKKHLGLDFPIIGNLTRLGTSIAGQFLINSASWIFLTRIVASFGTDAAAGYTIGIRVILFSLLPAWGMSNAAATLVGQNLGAAQPDRAERSVWRTGFLNTLFLVTIALIFFITAYPVIGLFSQDPAVIFYGVNTLRYICFGYLFYGYGMVLAQSFNGAGDSRTPTLLNLFGFWAFQIPLAYVLAIKLNFGARGAFSAIPIAESAMAVAAMILFKKGRWKTVKV
ncbi:MATE family efflux transporter [Chitinophagaceae bacterium MMS25-I14]